MVFFLIHSRCLTADYQDSHIIQQSFSAEKQPTPWHAIPQIEDLMSKWEDKLNDNEFAPFHDALHNGIAKIQKYYCKFNDKPALILALHMSVFPSS